MSRLRALSLLLILCALSAQARSMDDLVKELCSPACQGRRAGEPGASLAAQMLEQELVALDLAPLDGFPTHCSFFTFHPRTIITASSLGRVNDNGTVSPLSGSGWQMLDATASGLVHAPLLFCGYGIVALESGWDDLRGHTLEGKAVLLVRQVPEGLGDASPAWREACRLERRIEAARRKGAAAVLVADSPFTERPEAERALGPDAVFHDAGLLLAGLSSAVADTLLAGSGGGLKNLVTHITRTRKSQVPVALPGRWEIGARLSRPEKITRNLGVAIPGKGEAARRWIVLGAHFDHLGRGADGTGPVHPGADDNASGTALLMEVARLLKSGLDSGEGERRSLALVWFSGEEQGRLGSRTLVERHPAWLDSVDLMVNLDMVGRLRNQDLMVLGAQDHPELAGALESMSRHGLTVRATGESPGGDHESFLAAGIPAIMCFTGPHEDYHRPTDTPERLNLAGMGTIRDALVDFVPALLNPQLSIARPFHPQGEGATNAAPVRVAMGIVPGYESTGQGMPVQDVKAGSAAEAAGILKGDLLLSLGNFPVANIHDYTFALRHFSAGEELPVTLLRNGLRVQTRVTLTERAR